MRRLLVYLMIDTSGSMRGEPIEAVNNGLRSMVATLRQDPQALESVYLSIITYDRDVKVVNEPTALESFNPQPVKAPDSGPIHMGQALKVLIEQVAKDVRKSSDGGKGDWAPILFVLTDGKPSDQQEFVEACEQLPAVGFSSIIGCAAGPSATTTALERFCQHVVTMETMDGQSFAQFFQWVSEGIAANSHGGSGGTDLPPPPDEIRIEL